MSKVLVYQNGVILDKFSKSCSYILTVKSVSNSLIYQNGAILNKFCKIKKFKILHGPSKLCLNIYIDRQRCYSSVNLSKL